LLLAIEGCLGVVAGGIALIGIRPPAAPLAVVWLIGAYAIVYGALLTLRFLQGILSRSLLGSSQVRPARQQLTFSTHKECDIA
jgi:hypothetical protein